MGNKYMSSKNIKDIEEISQDDSINQSRRVFW